MKACLYSQLYSLLNLSWDQKEELHSFVPRSQTWSTAPPVPPSCLPHRFLQTVFRNTLYTKPCKTPFIVTVQLWRTKTLMSCESLCSRWDGILKSDISAGKHVLWQLHFHCLQTESQSALIPCFGVNVWNIWKWLQLTERLPKASVLPVLEQLIWNYWESIYYAVI